MTRTKYRVHKRNWFFKLVLCSQYFGSGRVPVFSLAAIFLALAMLIVQGSLFASPSGLNNIPTVDVAPHRVLVLQEYTNFVEKSPPSHTVGWKMGLFDVAEIGMDRKLGSGASGATLYQAKLKLDPARFGAEGSWPLFGAGVADVAFTKYGRQLTAQPFPYLVSSYRPDIADFDLGRAHLGVSLKTNDEGVFFGYDRELFKGFLFRTDYKTINNGDDLLSSWGFIYEPGWKFPFNIAIESWYATSSNSTGRDDVMIKFDYIIRF